MCLSRACIISKRLNIKSRKQRRKIAQELSFSGAKVLGKIHTESPLTVAPNAGGVGDFLHIIRRDTNTVQDRHTVSIKVEQQVIMQSIEWLCR